MQLQISALDYSSYVGRLGIGRIRRGRLVPARKVMVLHDGARVVRDAQNRPGARSFAGLERVPVDRRPQWSDIVLVTGIDDLSIGTTITSIDVPEALPMIAVDEPTLSMQFQVNTSPLAGREGKYVTSRNLRERLAKELLTNVALRVEDTADTDVFTVYGRGELQLTILLENMRREGYEMAVARPRVVVRQVDGVSCEPFEQLSVDVEDAHQGAVMESLGVRRGDLVHMESDARGRTRLEYRIPARGLIGFQGEFMNLTRGTGLMSHVFDGFSPVSGDIPERRNGVLISAEGGEAVAYALWKLQERGRMFVSPGNKLYEGMVIGIHSRDNDLVVNPIKGKQLTNVRSSGKDEAIALTPPIQLTLEYAVEFIADDELAEITLQIDTHPQAPSDRARAQAREPRSGLDGPPRRPSLTNQPVAKALAGRARASQRRCSDRSRAQSNSDRSSAIAILVDRGCRRRRSRGWQSWLNIEREYPAKLDHVLVGVESLASPRALHPAFFGSFDWHSCVHAHWLMARVLKIFPELPEATAMRRLLGPRS